MKVELSDEDCLALKGITKNPEVIRRIGVIEGDISAIPIAYRESVQVWEVSTELDDAGERDKDLGLYYGSIPDIAQFLAGAAMFSLRFKSYKPGVVNVPPFQKSDNPVRISFDIESNTGGMTPQNRAKVIQTIISNGGDPLVHVEPSSYYAAVSLNFEGSE